MWSRVMLWCLILSPCCGVALSSWLSETPAHHNSPCLRLREPLRLAYNCTCTTASERCYCPHTLVFDQFMWFDRMRNMMRKLMAKLHAINADASQRSLSERDVIGRIKTVRDHIVSVDTALLALLVLMFVRGAIYHGVWV